MPFEFDTGLGISTEGVQFQDQELYRLTQLWDGKETSDVFEKYVDLTNASGFKKKKFRAGKEEVEAGKITGRYIMEESGGLARPRKVDLETGRKWDAKEIDLYL
jgi:hypothetical protein